MLASDAVELDLAQSHLQPQGADENTMTLTLALRLKAVVGGKRYRVEMVATNDDGTMQGPEPMGSVTLSDSPGQQPALRIFLPLLRQ